MEFNLKLQHSSVSALAPQLFTTLYFVKGHLGCCSLDAPVVWQSGAANACWPACCHPDGGGERDQKGGAGQLEPLVIEGSDGEAPPPNSINRRK